MGTSKVNRAGAALKTGQRYHLNGDVYEFHSIESRAVRDWEPLSDLWGALWPLTPSDDPAYVVERNGGDIVGIDGWGTHRRAIDIIHETKHAERDYCRPWYSCDGIACGMIDL